MDKPPHRQTVTPRLCHHDKGSDQPVELISVHLGVKPITQLFGSADC
ncbi:MAG: hypothetical protein QM520_04355 [Gammaproteobacteria bacterium]|nr:hypothetical protein [Gammaproteobacteria bacterium]